MRRALISLLAAALLATAAVVPVSARTTATFTISPVCYNAGWDALYVYVAWANQTPSTGDATLTVAFNAKKVTDTVVGTYTAPVQATAYSPTLFQKFQLLPDVVTDWNSITSVSATMSGAFVATAKTIRQPHGGWALCP